MSSLSLSTRVGRRVGLTATLCLTLCLALGGAAFGSAQERLRFGMSTVLSGPAADLGRGMLLGVQTAFDEQNRAGGIQGKLLELVVLDDGYEPTRVVPNMHELLEKHHVLGIVGNVGTPTSIAAIPISNEARTLFFGAFTGAGGLRKSPPDRWVFNFRTSYAQETAAMVDALVESGGLQPHEIAVFTQRDAFGDSGFDGALAALKRHGLEDSSSVAHVRYERNTTDVEGALAELLLRPSAPRAVILVGAYQPCAKFVTLAREAGLEALFLNVSFVGAPSFVKAAGGAAEGVLGTQVVPNLSSAVPAVQRFRAALEAFSPAAEPTVISLEGYLVGRTLCLVLSKARACDTREGVVEAFELLGDFDLGLGRPLRLDVNQHQASHSIWPTRIVDGQVTEFEWSVLTQLLVSSK